MGGCWSRQTAEPELEPHSTISQEHYSEKGVCPVVRQNVENGWTYVVYSEDEVIESYHVESGRCTFIIKNTLSNRRRTVCATKSGIWYTSNVHISPR